MLGVIEDEKVRVLKYFGQWHWWCPCCMGGDWHYDIRIAWAAAEAHITRRHVRTIH